MFRATQLVRSYFGVGPRCVRLKFQPGVKGVLSEMDISGGASEVDPETGFV